ncbi:hypothetical protein [Marinomonas sp. 2405UD68-3]|uniref:hypothetical protein n=1 Tax=Marinomonas sp. 2405UD68-3 TaxID=3391835 RepID=UPI0039C9D4D5
MLNKSGFLSFASDMKDVAKDMSGKAKEKALEGVDNGKRKIHQQLRGKLISMISESVLILVNADDHDSVRVELADLDLLGGVVLQVIENNANYEGFHKGVVISYCGVGGAEMIVKNPNELISIVRSLRILKKHCELVV